MAPKLALLQSLLGVSETEACALIQSHPAILQLPVDTRLRPVLAALAAAGLDSQQLAQLLRACPELLAEPRDGLVSRCGCCCWRRRCHGCRWCCCLMSWPVAVSPLRDMLLLHLTTRCTTPPPRRRRRRRPAARLARVNFLQAVGCSMGALLQYPRALLVPLAGVTGPRVYYLARTGRLAAFTDDGMDGGLQLRRLLEPDLDGFLADVAQVCACGSRLCVRLTDRMTQRLRLPGANAHALVRLAERRPAALRLHACMHRRCRLAGAAASLAVRRRTLRWRGSGMSCWDGARRRRLRRGTTRMRRGCIASS